MYILCYVFRGCKVSLAVTLTLAHVHFHLTAGLFMLPGTQSLHEPEELHLRFLFLAKSRLNCDEHGKSLLKRIGELETYNR